MWYDKNLFTTTKIAYFSSTIFIGLIFLQIKIALSYVPPPLPLAPFPVVTPEDLKEYALDVAKVLGTATLPTQPDEAIALVVSESIAGFISGNAEKFSALIINDGDNYSKNLKGSVTTAYFGFRGGLRFVTTYLGIPSFISRPLSALIASIVAEIAKELDQKGESKRNSKPARLHHEFHYSQAAGTPTLSISNILKDVTKWVAYDFLVPSEFDQEVPLTIALKMGALAGLIAYLMVYLFEDFFKTRKAPNLFRFCQAGVESAALFFTYEASLSFLEEKTTPEIRKFLSKKFTEIDL